MLALPFFEASLIIKVSLSSIERSEPSNLLTSPVTSLNLWVFIQAMGTMMVLSLKVLLRNKWDDSCKDLRRLPGTSKCHFRFCCHCSVDVVNVSLGSLALAFLVYGTPLGQPTLAETVDAYEVSTVWGQQETWPFCMKKLLKWRGFSFA